MKRLAILSALALSACTAKTGLAVSVPPAPRSEFANIKRFRIRAITMDALQVNSPEQKAEFARDNLELPFGTDVYHEAALNTARRVLESKGYEVAVVWDDPYVYGADRPCIGPKPTDRSCTPEERQAGRCEPEPWYTKCKHERANEYHGTFIQMASFAGTLAPDEAFLELVTRSSVMEWQTTSRTSGEHEVGRVTDANGNTTGRLYETTTDTHTEDHRREFSSSAVQVFVAGRSRPLYDAQAWSEKSANLVYTTEEVLSKIPARR